MELSLSSASGPNSKFLSRGIETWLLYLQQFCYAIKQIQGKDNSADVLSRHPVGPAQTVDAEKSKACACNIASQAIPSTLTPMEVELASENDRTLRLVRNAIKTDNWTCLTWTIYKALSDDM